MRMIEQFVQSLIAIFRARKEGNYEEAVKMIQTASRFYLDADIATILKSDPDQILDLFRDAKSKRLDVDRCYMCADLLNELALVSDAKQNKEASLRLKMLCLQLYITAIPKEKEFQTRESFEKVSAILNDLKGQGLPESVSNNLNKYHESFGEK